MSTGLRNIARGATNHQVLGYAPRDEGRGPYPPPNNGEAPPRFLTPADVPNGHGAPPNGHYDARGPRAPPPAGAFRGV